MEDFGLDEHLAVAPIPRQAAAGRTVPGAAAARRRALADLRPWARGALGLLCVLAALALFILALRVLQKGAGGLTPVLDRLSAEGIPGTIGVGWLGAYLVMSGSPVAAASLSLFSSGVISDTETFAMINGSRFGASFVVLLVGLLSYLRHRRGSEGLYVGVVAMLTTFTIYAPAMLLGLAMLNRGWLDGLSVGTPDAIVSATDATFGPAVQAGDDYLPLALLFALGIGLLLGSFHLFDRVLPNLDPPSRRLERVLAFFHRPLAMFAMGGLVTLVTLSVSISLTLLVPLSLKGIVRRQSIVPYVMGANITTFVDTLFAALLLDTPRAFTIVLAEVVGVALVSVLVLLLAYRPYCTALLSLARRATASWQAFLLFVAAILVVPAVLLMS